MSPSYSRAIYFFALISTVKSAFPPSLRYPLPVSLNKITEVALSCDSRNFNITVRLQYPFKGLLFAKDFSQECNALGSLTDSVSISLPTSGCGIRLSSRTDAEGQGQMVYSVTLVAQQDRHLRQIADQEKHVECLIDDDAFLIRSQSMIDAVKNELNPRVPRMRKMPSISDDNNNEEKEEDDKEALGAARAWMEIIPEEEKLKGTLQVGEPALLIVKSTLPVGIGWKIVECSAQDGLGDSSQKLLDEDGCAIDELLMPSPHFGAVQPISLMQHQEAVSRFAAFKFPDRDRLHLSCRLELCRGNCTEVDCRHRNNGSDNNRFARNIAKGAQGEILDRLEVFNSVQVLSPAIDDLRKSSEKLSLHSDPSTLSFGGLPGDRTFCVSTDKIAITFCVLGAIFLCAVIVAACALLRSRRSGTDGPFYTRSLFSSSSGGSAYGSKLLLHESPCIAHSAAGTSSNGRGMPYGRIL